MFFCPNYKKHITNLRLLIVSFLLYPYLRNLLSRLSLISHAFTGLLWIKYLLVHVS